MFKNTTAIILAGGEGKRFYFKNKAFIKLLDKPLISWILDNLRNSFEEIIIIANSQIDLFKSYNYPVYEDLIKKRGPLGGIFSGLFYSKTDLNFIIPCDLPFLKSPIINILANFALDFEIVVPVVSKYIEPLVGFYKKSCIGKILLQLSFFKQRVKDLYNICKVKYVKIENLDHSFFNINTFSDLRKAQDIAKKLSKGGRLCLA